MLPRPRRLAGPLALVGVLGALFSAGAARAQLQVTVVPTVTRSGALFNYSYSITNFTPTDLFIVDLNNLPKVPGALTNLTAPTGFQISPYDPGVGIESFVADSQDFTPGVPVSGFSFSSIFGPGTIPFDAQDLNGSMFNGTTLAPVPEASTLISLGAGVLLLTFSVVRRRRAARAAVRSGVSMLWTVLERNIP